MHELVYPLSKIREKVHRNEVCVFNVIKFYKKTGVCILNYRGRQEEDRFQKWQEDRELDSPKSTDYILHYLFIVIKKSDILSLKNNVTA